MNKSEINGLRAKIEHYNTTYRTGNPKISDAEYDKLVEQLRDIDPENDWFKHIEPVPVENLRKRKLPIPMKSLDKAKTIEELQQWVKSLGIENQMLVITPKFDGISLLYDQRTHQAYSRGGSDNEGQDCSSHAAQVNGILQNVLRPTIHYTFGELVFKVNAWETFFKGRKSSYSGMPYKSPRNTIAGFINRDEPDTDLQYSTFFRYGMDDNSLEEFDTFKEMYQYLCGMYNQPLLMHYISSNQLDETFLKECFDEWSKVFYIDGLVIYINDLELWKMIGRHQTTGNPKYAIAYKNPDFTPIFESTVQGVSWKVSKAGYLKPVVNIDAIDTGDCEMNSPTGYNAKFIFEKGIGKGAVVKITRSGGVIPKIIDVIEEASTETMFQQREDLLYCPNCGKPITWNDSKVELVCTNPNCSGINLAKACHFYNTLGAENMGEETISKLFKAGYDNIRRILDITFEEIVRIDMFGECIANTILSTNKRIREGVEVVKLMHASDCFEGIGQVKAKNLLSEMNPNDRFAFINGYVLAKEGFDTTPEFLQLPKTMQAFLKGVTPFYEFVATNQLKILPMEEKLAPIGNKYSGMKVCFTGVRDKDLEGSIVLHGGEIVNGVTKNTTHLIVADTSTQSVKAKKARSLGLPIMTVEEFKQL